MNMESRIRIPVRATTHPHLAEVDFDHLEFGKYTADHMLVADYTGGKWVDAQIVPYANLSMNPATLALHYGQTVFEGMKAFRMDDGRVNIFRIQRHYDRFVRSLDRMCMAAPPRELFFEGLARLIELDRGWVPSAPGSALYIRPFVYASEARFGVKVSEQYRFIIFTGPVPEVFAQPIRVKVETHFARAARGGTGFAKCGGNYGGAFLPTQQARAEGFDQILWTDAGEHNFIEESGMMNAMFVIEGKLVTPPLSDSILDGVTRDSLLTLARHLGISVEERPVSLTELESSLQAGKLTEAFGAGTAAVVAPIRAINIKGSEYALPAYTPESVMNRLKKKLEGIRAGREEDIFGWNYVL